MWFNGVRVKNFPMFQTEPGSILQGNILNVADVNGDGVKDLIVIGL